MCLSDINSKAGTRGKTLYMEKATISIGMLCKRPISITKPKGVMSMYKSLQKKGKI